MDGPARSGVNPVSMRLAWRGVHLGCVSGLPLLPARLWVGNPSLVARRWRGFINLAMPLILIDTTFWADALTYVLPAPIRRINSGSSTPGWQCMFGPSPYIGVLSPEQRPWRRSCHHRSVVGVHPRIGWRAAFSTRCHLFGCDSGLSAMRLTPWIHSGPSCSSLLHAGDGSHLVSGVPGGMSSICFGWHLMLITAMDVGPNLWVQIVTSPPWHAHSSPSNS